MSPKVHLQYHAIRVYNLQSFLTSLQISYLYTILTWNTKIPPKFYIWLWVVGTNAIYRLCITELYTWNLYILINQCCTKLKKKNLKTNVYLEAFSLAGVAEWIECQTVNQRVKVWFPVRAHAWVAAQAPSRGCSRSNHTLLFLFLPPFLSLKINK